MEPTPVRGGIRLSPAELSIDKRDYELTSSHRSLYWKYHRPELWAARASANVPDGLVHFGAIDDVSLLRREKQMLVETMVAKVRAVAAKIRGSV